ncbi:histidine kinase [Bacteroides sp. 519]|uniref:tetratricopeptide repeat-containing sensor histidine kinase n=1 Tax=Bacteroides sp. 519 TaxID=2302937 RepID=UPI0013D4EE75|nr:histidine kinase [Bacteroides sp. 519]NDV56625.1 sensor histidine kinase [Bacteroides sp. 519]
MVKKWLFCICFISLPLISWGQDSIPVQKISKRSAASKLSRSLEQDSSAQRIAEDYMKLAQQLAFQNDYAKAETYYFQAASSFAKLKNREQEALAFREMAKTQEYQLKFEEAIKSYIKASKKTRLKDFSQVNTNDASRLQNRDNLVTQSRYIQSNIALNSKTQNRNDAVFAFQQMAQVNLEQADKTAAIGNLQNALELVKDEPEESSKIKEEIAKVYVADEQFEQAISINQSLVEEAKKTADPVKEVSQLQNLSQTYFQAQEAEKAIASLKDAYNVAIENNQTLVAKNVLQQLTQFYQDKKKSKEAMEVYADFVSRLDTLIKADSTLVDEKIFQLHEDKIAQLEKERVLKDELINKKNVYNNMLLGFLIISLLLIIIIAKSLYSINKKNKKIALQSLRREMNPHFIFNSLNSVNQFIAQNNELEANKYLTSYSRLMRNIMENSNKDFITLTTEIDQLKKYLELEHLRFNDKFAYDIRIDDTLDTDSLYVPNMLIQPQLENAIWHGLRYKESKGMLTLSFVPASNRIKVEVEDNGIGLANSKSLKTTHQKQHNSRGLSNTRERIQLLNKLYHLDISMNITDKTGDAPGVIVTLSFPVIDKKLINDEHITENNQRNS